MRYADIWPKYAKYWDEMIINANRVAEFTAEAQFAIAHSNIYTQISDATGVPGPLLAVIHRREGNANFNTYLGNGQPLSMRTTIVPKGRGPFTGPNAFVTGGIDAVRQEGWGNITDWRLEKQLYYCMLFNGDGYEAYHNEPSPYVWGGTNIQKPGKYVSDGRWKNVEDTQPGCAPMLWMIAHLDPTVTFTRES